MADDFNPGNASVAFRGTSAFALLENAYRGTQAYHAIETRLGEALGARGETVGGTLAMLLWRIGMHLNSGRKLMTGDIGKRGYYLGTNVSYSVKKLENSGYIRREGGSDRRVAHIMLTPRGEAVAQHTEIFLNALMGASFAHIGVAQQSELERNARVMEMVTDNVPKLVL